MVEEIAKKDFDHQVIRSLQWLLDQIYRHQGNCTYTVVYNENQKIIPNNTLEEYLRIISEAVGFDSEAMLKTVNLYEKNGYNKLYNIGCKLSDLKMKVIEEINHKPS